MEGAQRGAPLPASVCDAAIGRIGLRERPVAIQRQPGVQAVVLALGQVQVGGREIARGEAARPQAAPPSGGRGVA